jgi:hypothetical protein
MRRVPAWRLPRARNGEAVLIDLHTRTYPLSSCSSLSLDALVERSQTLGLDGLGLTEHDKLWSTEELDRASRKHGFLLLRGSI